MPKTWKYDKDKRDLSSSWIQVERFLIANNMSFRGRRTGFRLFLDHFGIKLPYGMKLNDFIIGLYRNKDFQHIGPENTLSPGFYMTKEWKTLRLQAIEKYGKKCMVCKSEERIEVDHIIPRSVNPSLELDMNNLQVLCKSCNSRKGHVGRKDCRPTTIKDEPLNDSLHQ